MDPFGPACDVVHLSVGANQVIDNVVTAGLCDGFLVGAVLTPGSAAATATIFRNNGGTTIAALAAAASGNSAIFLPNWGVMYFGASPALSATVAGTGATLDVYYKKRH